MYVFVSLINCVYIICLRLQIFWHIHVQYNFEHLDPWSDRVVLFQEWTEE